MNECPVCKQPLLPGENWWYDEEHEQSMCPRCGKNAQGSDATEATFRGHAKFLREQCRCTTYHCVCGFEMAAQFIEEQQREIERLRAIEDGLKDLVSRMETRTTDLAEGHESTVGVEYLRDFILKGQWR